MCHLGEGPQDITNFKAHAEFQLGQEALAALFPSDTQLPGHSRRARLPPELPPCPRRLSLQPAVVRLESRGSPNPHKTLRQKVRQFVYWQISAENHEPYIPRSSVPCYIRVVTIPLGKVQKINKQAKLVLTYQGAGSEQRGWCR